MRYQGYNQMQQMTDSYNRFYDSFYNRIKDKPVRVLEGYKSLLEEKIEKHKFCSIFSPYIGLKKTITERVLHEKRFEKPIKKV